MRTLLLAVAILVTPKLASAGVCLSEEELDEYLVQLEAAAKSPAKVADLSDHWNYCLQGNEKRKPRIVKACTAIAARLDMSKRKTLDSPPDEYMTFAKQELCLRALTGYQLGPIKTKGGDYDYVAYLLGGKFLMQDDPSDSLSVLAQSKDPRVLPKVLEIYKAHLATAAKSPPKGWREQNWIRWHRAAIALIGALGSTTDLAFLDEVRAGSKDKRVHVFVDAAKKAIEAR
jgi:hypothetical protein